MCGEKRAACNFQSGYEGGNGLGRGSTGYGLHLCAICRDTVEAPRGSRWEGGRG